jgi:hypothetical protein
MKKKCKIVLIPSDEKSNLHKFGDCLDVNAHLQIWHGNAKPEYQNLFILSPDEEIRSGDWYYDEIIGIQQKLSDLKSPSLPRKKIIATTGPSLNLPLIPTTYLKEYIKDYNNGVIPTEVEVEYIVDKFDIRNQYKDCPSGKYHDDEPIPPSPDNLFSNPLYFIPKLSPDNTINIKKAKDSWTREEVIELFDEFFTLASEGKIDNVENWIKIKL